MPKMIIIHKIILTRPDPSDDKKIVRMVLTPGRKGKPQKVFDFTADERDSILSANPNALRKPDGDNVEIAQPAAAPLTGDKGGDEPNKTQNKSEVTAEDAAKDDTDEDKL